MKRILIAPSILSADFSRLQEEIRDVERCGADWIHVDVMDGHFVPNLTIGPAVLDSARGTTSLPMDVHLMISDPGKYMESFITAGADIITFHIEACPDPADLIARIKKLGKKAGLSVRPKTPVEAILPYVSDLDLALVMTVEPGFGGQKFMPEMMPKIRRLRETIDAQKYSCLIEVDGGINEETARPAAAEGADVLVAGNAVFGRKDRMKAIESIRNSSCR